MSTNTLAGVASTSEMVQFCRTLGDETRLAILRRLTLTDLRGGDMVKWLEMSQNAVSYHLKYLRDMGLVADHRSSADARDIYYHLDLPRLRRFYTTLGDALEVARESLPDEQSQPSLDRPLRVLFLCTHNSARSQLAEGLAHVCGGGRIAPYSAGSHPTAVLPEVLALLQARGVDTTGYRAKPLSEFTEQAFDYVVTVCDRIREVCPSFLGDPMRLHWSIPDPSMIEDDADRQLAFSSVVTELELRIEHFLRVVGDAVQLRRSS